LKTRLKHFTVWCVIILGFASVSTAARNHGQNTASEKSGYPQPVIAKWYNNQAAAVSLTYDDGCPFSPVNRQINHFLVEKGITMDYEVVTFDYLRSQDLKNFLINKLIPFGMGYFGHGHHHVNHDQLTYEEALISFQRCYNAMKTMGLKPVAYAYPMGAGYEAKTRQALADSGFLCGRLHISYQMENAYIVPNEKMEPEDWFGLPTFVMQDFSFNQCQRCINNNDELIPVLEQAIMKTAWIILTYHAIGDEKGYGYYKLDEFKKNVAAIGERSFWNASMGAVTLYIRERLHAVVKVSLQINHQKEITEISLIVSDGLPDYIYNQPLTILFKIPDSWVGKPLEFIDTAQSGHPSLPLCFNSVEGMVSILPDDAVKRLVLAKRVVKNKRRNSAAFSRIIKPYKG